jgi:PAS domain-containing protein
VPRTPKISATSEWHAPISLPLICSAAGLASAWLLDASGYDIWASVASGTIVGLATFCLVELVALVRTSREKRLISAALDNMSEGLAMFNSAGKLVLFNWRYAEMYELSTEWLAADCTVVDLLDVRKRIGKFDSDPKLRMAELVTKMQGARRSGRSGEFPRDRSTASPTGPRRAADGYRPTRTSPSSSGERGAHPPGRTGGAPPDDRACGG